MIRQLSYIISILVLVMVVSLPAYAQEEEAIALYETGDYERASALFKEALESDSESARLWNFYGLALQNNSKTKKARKAFEQAVRLEPENGIYASNLSFVYLMLRDWNRAEKFATNAIRLQQGTGKAYYYRSAAKFGRGEFDDALDDCETAIGLFPGEIPLYLLKSEIYLRKFVERNDDNALPDKLALLKASIITLEDCISVCEGKLSAIETRLSDQRVLYNYYDLKRRNDESEPLPPTVEANCDPLKILNKPTPGYTQQARQQGVIGEIRLMVFFGSDGKIGQVVVLKGLPAGLNEAAIGAARAIKFKPEMCDGKPKAAVKTISYSFSIY